MHDAAHDPRVVTVGAPRYPRTKYGGFTPHTSPHSGDYVRSLSFSTRVAPSVVGTKLCPPALRLDRVDRAALVERVNQSSVPLVVVNAPAGYGKTTLLAQCATASEQPVAWVSLDASDNDPVLLFTEIATAVGRVTSVDPGLFNALLEPEPALITSVIPRLINDLSRGPAVTLVLDDVHLVRAAAAVESLRVLCLRLPTHMKLVLAGRAAPALPLARLRASGTLLELGASELAFSDAEARRLVVGCGVRLEDATFEALYERTEGWPTGLYLAALAAHASDSPDRTAREFGGDNRDVFDYVSTEVLAQQPPDRLAFLMQTSLLQRFTAPLCDAVLGRNDSAEIIDDLECSTGFLVALDSRREWFRYQHVFAEVLQTALSRAGAGNLPDPHMAASRWHERHGTAAEAIDHALLGGDRERAAQLLAQHGRELFVSTDQPTLRRWIQGFSDADFAAYPPAAAAAAWVMGQLGERAHTRRYISILEHTAATGPFPLGESSSKSAVALLKAAFAWEGVSQMRALADLAYGLEPRGSEAHARAALFVGATHLLRGRFDAAPQFLEEAAQVDEAGASTALFAMGLLGVLHLELQRRDVAQARVSEGLALMETLNLHGHTAAGALLAVGACLDLERGERDAAMARFQGAVSLLPTAKTVPWWSILLGTLCGRIGLGLGQIQQAEAKLLEAERELARYPDSGMLPHWLLREQRALEAARGGSGILSEPLTEAELRVLELAPTYLTLEEIGRCLCISRNTVKTHLKVIYSKLNASSRGEAVERAEAVGLLGNHRARLPR